MVAPTEPAAKVGQEVTGQVSIQKIYVKDLSFEAPNSPQVFSENWEPTVDIHINNAVQPLGEDLIEVVLGITVTVKAEDKTVYLVELQQAGLFEIRGLPAEHLQALTATACPNILFPFAREAVSDAITRGGFPQLLLAPVNFEQLYAQERARSSGHGEQSESTH